MSKGTPRKRSADRWVRMQCRPLLSSTRNWNITGHGRRAILRSWLAFQADTMWPRSKGFSISDLMTWVSWSMPYGHQLRHCAPYTGPSSPSSSAHASQMWMPRSWSGFTLVPPEIIHSSSPYRILNGSFFVVSIGIRMSRRSARMVWPKRAFVPVPVRSGRSNPVSITLLTRSRYDCSPRITSPPSVPARLPGRAAHRCPAGMAHRC